MRFPARRTEQLSVFFLELVHLEPGKRARCRVSKDNKKFKEKHVPGHYFRQETVPCETSHLSRKEGLGSCLNKVIFESEEDLRECV